MFFTDDPVADYARYDAERQKELDRLPRCCECGEPIQDEFAYYINDEWMHERCMDDNYKRPVPDGY